MRRNVIGRVKAVAAMSMLVTCAGCSLIRGDLGSTPSNAGQGNAQLSLARNEYDGLAWVETSAEYVALCEQAYRGATQRVLRVLNDVDHRRTGKPLAVILDLDETVLDTSSFLAYLRTTNKEYSQALWNDWNQACAGSIEIVPGARAFLELLNDRHVTPIFVSNRSDSLAETTFAVLERLALLPKPLDKKSFLNEQLLLRSSHENKEARRREVARRFHVIAMVGDNLADFSDAFDSRADGNWQARRAMAAGELAEHWGVDWFVLPNPLYGDWRTSVKSADVARLVEENARCNAKR